MQKIRAVRASDFRQIERIHKLYFADQFSLPDFMTNYIAAFVVEEGDNEIIVAGGVRTIAEAVMITDKDVRTENRREAMLSMMTAMMQIAKLDKYDQLHAFVQEDKWKRHLIRVGFRQTRGDSLVIDLE